MVEAFRICLKESATKPPVWDTENYGAGILNVYELLKCELPDVDDKKYAYANDPRQEWDLGVREAVHFLWKALLKKNISAQESSQEMAMTERSRIAVSAMTGNPVSSIFEAYSINAVNDSEKILKMYFYSYKKI